MDPLVGAVLSDLSTSLTALSVKGTVSAVSTKIKAIQTKKDVEAVRNSYDEIVNELLSEREEAVRIAQVYKSELDRYQISDEDIKHLHATVERVLEILSTFSPATNVAGLDQFKDLISIDTLKAMQLLGFNYRKAIGEPLTELCATKIAAIAKTAQGGGKPPKRR